MKNTYTCAHCGGIFEYDEEWTDEDAKKEAEANGYDVDDCDIVCDDCYNKYQS